MPKSSTQKALNPETLNPEPRGLVFGPVSSPGAPILSLSESLGAVLLSLFSQVVFGGFEGVVL